MGMQVRRLSYALGAEVSGVDISKPLDDKTFAEIRKSWLEHCVLVFRGQSLTREQQVAFSRRFGELDQNLAIPLDRKPPGLPEVSVILSKPKPNGEPATGRYSGQKWHSDRSHLPVPAMASLLRCIECPDIGGDTQFANMYRAYDTLSDGMKKLLEGLEAVHMDGFAVIDYSTPEREAESRRQNPAAAQPVIRVHPETGRKTLYVNEETRLFVGMTGAESKLLLEYLINHAIRPQHIYRHRWQKDDLVIWDNRCLLHIALADFDRTKVRHMERTTVNGTPSGYNYLGPLE